MDATLSWPFTSFFETTGLAIYRYTRVLSIQPGIPGGIPGGTAPWYVEIEGYTSHY